jgi:hypothetical protein
VHLSDPTSAVDPEPLWQSCAGHRNGHGLDLTYHVQGYRIARQYWSRGIERRPSHCGSLVRMLAEPLS